MGDQDQLVDCGLCLHSDAEEGEAGEDLRGSAGHPALSQRQQNRGQGLRQHECNNN